MQDGKDILKPINNDFYTKDFYQIIKYLDKGEFQKGCEFADVVIAKNKKEKNTLRELDAIIGKIENIICLGLFDDAFELVKDGKELLKKIRNENLKFSKKRDAYLKFLEGRVYAEKFDMFPAIKLFNQSYKLRKETGDIIGMMWSLLNLGTSLVSIGKFKEGEKYLKDSLNLAEKIEVEVGVIWNLINLSGIQYHLRDLDKSIFYAEKCLSITEPKGYKHSSSMCYYIIGNCLIEKGELDLALEDFKKSLNYRLETGYKNLIAESYYSIGNVYSQKGELKRSLDYYKKILKIPEIRKDQILKPAYFTTIGKIYGELGDFSKAKQFLFGALELFKKQKIFVLHYLNFNLSITKTLHYLINILVHSKNSENVNDYLEQLNEISRKNPNIKQYKQLFVLDKAIVLKSSDRLKEKMEAARIFKDIVQDKIYNHEITIEAMVNLCELLIFELELTGNKKILNEIEDLSDELLKIAKSQYLYNLLAETYFLKAKISLIHFDLNTARILLIKAQNTAKMYGLKRLANRISNEHDYLLNNLNKWKKMAENKISLEERIKHARHEFLYSKMVRTKIEEPTKNDFPIYFVIIYPLSGRCLYSKSFQNMGINDDDLIASFLTAINIFGKEAFSSSGSIDRIKHGDYLMIIKFKDNLSFGYVFKGHSFSATSKLDHFIEVLSTLENIVENLMLSVKTFVEISKETHLTIEQLVNHFFLSDNNNDINQEKLNYSLF